MSEDGAKTPGRFRRLLGDSLVYGLGRMAGYLVALILMPVYTHHLTVEEYGVLENLYVLAMLLNTLVPLGLPGAVQRFWFLSEEADDRRQTVGTGLASLLVLFALCLPVLYLLAPAGCRAWFGDESAVAALRIAIVTILPAGLLSFALSLLKVRFRALHFGLLSVLQVGLLAVLNTYFVAGRGMGVTGVFLGGLLAVGITTAVALWAVRADLTFTLSGARLRAMLAYGLPLLPSVFAFWALGYADRALLTGISGLTEVGLYSAGAKIAGVLLFVNFATTTAFLPLALEAADGPGAKRFFARSLTAYAGVAAAAAVGLSALGREAVDILAPAEYVAGSRVIPWLATGLLLAGCAPIVNIGMHITRKTHHVAWIALVAAGANILLNLLLIPAHGMIGAAIGTATAYLLMTALYWIVTQRIYPVRWEVGRLLRLAGIYAAALVVLHMQEGGNILIRLAVAAVFPILLLVTRVLDPAEVRSLLTRRSK